MNIEIEVKDQRLTAKSPRNLVAGTAGLTTFTAAFDESWAELKKTLLFEAAGGDGRRRTVELLLEESQGQVPWEVLERPGALRISAIGVSEDGIRRPTAMMAEPLRVIPSGAAAGSPSGARTPALWEQAVIAAKASAKAAVTAEAASEEAVQRAGEAIASAENAVTKAENAALAASAAAAEAERVNIRAEQTPAGAAITVTDRTGRETSVQIDAVTAANTWAYVKQAVRLGLGPKLFPVGYEFTTRDSDTGQDIIWAVRGHDHHTPANRSLKHSMTLEMKHVYSGADGARRTMAISSNQALYYAETALSPGTYNFTIVNQAWYPADNGKTFQFTLTKSVPQGGQILLSYSSSNVTAAGKTVTARESQTATEPLESAVVSLGSAGTHLGQTDGSGNVNHFHRLATGSNNYAQSAVRQWLNSGGESGGWYQPQEKFAVYIAAPVSDYPGFLHGLPQEFLSVVEAAEVPCRTNNVYEGEGFDVGSAYTVKDKFFLLSESELFGASEDDTAQEGEILEYYEGLTDLERRRYDNAGTSSSIWTRSCDPDSACAQRYVGNSGAVSANNAYNRTGVAAACVIA